MFNNIYWSSGVGKFGNSSVACDDNDSDCDDNDDDDNSQSTNDNDNNNNIGGDYSMYQW